MTQKKRTENQFKKLGKELSERRSKQVFKIIEEMAQDYRSLRKRIENES